MHANHGRDEKREPYSVDKPVELDRDSDSTLQEGFL